MEHEARQSRTWQDFNRHRMAVRRALYEAPWGSEALLDAVEAAIDLGFYQDAEAILDWRENGGE